MVTEQISITKITPAGAEIQQDIVALEAQYRVSVNERSGFSFTCTPSHLAEMVTGALYSRGYITCAAEIGSVREEVSQIFVELRQAEQPKQPAPQRPKLDLETVFQTVNTIFRDPDTLFNRTGCAHSCSLLLDGRLVCTFEDIGRHNALDKVIGFALRGRIPMGQCVIFTSGRISGDYMAKIIHAGFPIAVSRAAVTSEAVRLAKEHGITLYGFVRGNTANLYTD